MQYLAQDLILLALDDQTGKIRSTASAALSYSLMGAVLLDLVLQGKLTIANDYLVVADDSATGDDFLDQCFNEVLTAPHARKVRFWVNHWRSKYSGFRKVVLQNLVELGVLTRQEQQVLWIFPVERYFLIDPSIQQALADHIRAAVLEDRGLDSRTAALISLIQTSHLINPLFAPEERREARLQIKAISSGERVGKAVSEAIANAQAAITASITTVIVASTSASSSSSNH